MIAFESVHVRRGTREVLRGISFRVARGETVALAGRSGAGKSTVLKLINRMLEPEHGRVLVEGRDTREWERTSLRRHAGYVLQDVGLFPHMSIARNVGLVPALARVSGQLVPFGSPAFDAGIVLVELTPQRTTLEDRYLSLVQGGAR